MLAIGTVIKEIQQLEKGAVYNDLAEPDDEIAITYNGTSFVWLTGDIPASYSHKDFIKRDPWVKTHNSVEEWAHD